MVARQRRRGVIGATAGGTSEKKPKPKTEAGLKVSGRGGCLGKIGVSYTTHVQTQHNKERKVGEFPHKRRSKRR